MMLEALEAQAEDAGTVVGLPVEVWNTYLGRWSRGFLIGEIDPTGVRLRRRSDGALLPALFDKDAVRHDVAG
jgi:hypothetical protein